MLSGKATAQQASQGLPSCLGCDLGCAICIEMNFYEKISMMNDAKCCIIRFGWRVNETRRQKKAATTDSADELREQ